MAFNSTIKTKVGKCPDCPPDAPSKPLCAGRCQFHYKQYRHEVRQVINNSKQRGITIPPDEDRDMRKWFADRGKEMIGKCVNCGGKTCKGNPKYEIYSIAHILPQKNFESIKTHPFNSVELCHFISTDTLLDEQGEEYSVTSHSCHTNFDNNGYEYAKRRMPNLWKFIVARFKILYKHITPEEHQFIPQVLLETLKQ